MKMQRVVKMLLVVLCFGLWCVPTYGTLIGDWNFAGTTGGNVTDSVGGRNLTSYGWTAANSAGYFKVWNGTVDLKVKWNASTGSAQYWTWVWGISSTGIEWANAYVGGTIRGDAQSGNRKTQFYAGTGGNGDTRYSDVSSQQVPLGEWSTLRYAWQFNEVTHKISSSIWINGNLVGVDTDVTPDAYPGYASSSQWWMNKISLVSNTSMIEYDRVQLYNTFIPEPSTVILLSIGGAVLAHKRKRA